MMSIRSRGVVRPTYASRQPNSIIIISARSSAWVAPRSAASSPPCRSSFRRSGTRPRSSQTLSSVRTSTSIGHLRLARDVLEQRRAAIRAGIPPDVELRRPGGIADRDVDDDRCRSDGRDRRRDDLPGVRVRLDHHDLCTGEDRGDVPGPVAAERTAVDDDLGREPEIPRVPQAVVPGRQDAFRSQPLSLADDVEPDGTERPASGALEGGAGPAAHDRPIMRGAPRPVPSGRSSRGRTEPASGR